MSDKKEGTPRATPGKMTTWLGAWVTGEENACLNGRSVAGKLVFVVDTTLAGPTAAQMRDAIKLLGVGKHASIVGRTDEHTYAKKEVDVIA